MSNRKYLVIYLALGSIYINSTNADETPVDWMASTAEAVSNSAAIIGPTIKHEYQKWFRREQTITGVSYDVRKTSSLISPYIGEISFLCIIKVASAATKEKVISAPYDPDFVSECKINYAFQPAVPFQHRKKHWVAKGATCDRDRDGDFRPVSPMSTKPYEACAVYLLESD